MTAWKQGTSLASKLLVVGFFTVLASCEQPRRRPRDRVIAAQDDIPITSFTCANKTQGYYADVETGCQVYHMCDGGRQFSYRCPDTTLFQQRMLICAHWYQVNCSRSEQHYSANLLIGQRDKPFVDEADYIHIYFNGKGINTLKNPDELQNLNGNSGLTQNNQMLHNKRVAAPVSNNADEKIINTHIAPTQSVFINAKPSFNPQFSNQFSNQNFKTHAATTQAVFSNTNFESSKQNFKANVEPTRTVFSNENSNSNFQFSNQNFHPKIETTPVVIPTTAIPNSNFAFNNQNFKPFESQNSRQPTPLSQTRTTSFTSVSKLAANPTVQTQFEEKVSTHNTFSNQNTNSPIIQTNEYNNFIKRFNPDSITEAIIKDNRNDDSFLQYNNFIKRFNPDEESFNNVNTANNSAASFVNSNSFGKKFESHNLEPPVQPPSSVIEVPFGDAEQMESNNLELHFQDPRQAFFIPDSDSQIIPAESVTPITVHIPRNAEQQFHPMLFINSVSDSCFRCHPSFIVDKASCTPCVIIR